MALAALLIQPLGVDRSDKNLDDWYWKSRRHLPRGTMQRISMSALSSRSSLPFHFRRFYVFRGSSRRDRFETIETIR